MILSALKFGAPLAGRSEPVVFMTLRVFFSPKFNLMENLIFCYIHFLIVLMGYYCVWTIIDYCGPQDPSRNKRFWFDFILRCLSLCSLISSACNHKNFFFSFLQNENHKKLSRFNLGKNSITKLKNIENWKCKLL